MSVFAITTVRGKDPEALDLRMVGLFESAEKAAEVLDKNYGDLDEAGYYGLAIVEEVEFGLYPERTFIAAYHYQKSNNKWSELFLGRRVPLVESFLEKYAGFALVG